MGCAASRQIEGGDDVVSLCKERKRLLKLAVERRYAFANAQAKYNQSLYCVAMALGLFIARHSSPSSPFLITFPSSSSVAPSESLLVKTNFHHHTPSAPISEVFARQDSSGSRLSTTSQQEQVCGSESEIESETESESENGERICKHFYDDVGAPKLSSLEEDFGWDFFFGPFDKGGVALSNDCSISLNGDLREPIELEGIPELEEDGEEQLMGEAENADMGNGNGRGLEEESEEKAVEELGDSNRLIGTPGNGRELLDALKDIMDHFVKAYESGLDVSKMLEANRVQLQSGLEEIKESSSKLVRSITRSRSTISRSYSCRSSLSSTSISSSTWVESKSDPFGDCGMQAGSHSLTLGRLYVWEKKLYEEVKAGDEARKLFEQKCLVGNRSAVSDGLADKYRAEVRELHATLSVAIASIESVSDKIQKLRDEELHPQLLELLDGLMKYWKIMFDSHETQRRVMLEVNSFACSAYAKLSCDSQRLATVQLEAEVDNWRCSFSDFVSSQKAYIEALHGWLSKFIDPEVEFCPSNQPTVLSNRDNGLPLLITCHNWLACTGKLPEKTVSRALKGLGRNIRILWSQQGKELQQKRKVEALAKRLIRRALAFEKEERRILESTEIVQRGLEISMHGRIAHLAERKRVLDTLKKRLEAQKEEHLSAVNETEHITLEILQTGFSFVFESLAEFSRACLNMHAHVVKGSSYIKEENNIHVAEPGSSAPS